MGGRFPDRCLGFADADADAAAGADADAGAGALLSPLGSWQQTALAGFDHNCCVVGSRFSPFANPYEQATIDLCPPRFEKVVGQHDVDLAELFSDPFNRQPPINNV